VSLLLAGLEGRSASAADASSHRETVVLDVPVLAAKKLETVRGLFEQQEWDTGLTVLAEVEAEFADGLAAVGPGRYLNISEYTRLLISQLPPEGLAVYRSRVDQWAERQFEEAVARRSPAELRHLLETAYASSRGDDALWQLGEWHFERGQMTQASRCWEQLLPPEPAERLSPLERPLHFPDPAFSEAEVAARLLLCWIMVEVREGVEDAPSVAVAGNMARSGRFGQGAGAVNAALEAYRERFPEAIGHLAGRDGRLADTLRNVWRESLQWPRDPGPVEWLTVGQDSRRNGVIPRRGHLGAPCWTMSLGRLIVPRWERDRPALPPSGALSRHTVAAEGTLYVSDGVEIRALRLEDGRPRWPVAGGNDAGVVYPPGRVLRNWLPIRPAVGVPRFSLTLSEGRLYGMLGPAVLSLPEVGLRASPSQLVCLGVSREEGRLEWIQAVADLWPEEWSVTGTPVSSGLSDGRLLVPLLRIDPHIECAVASLWAADGSVHWERSVGIALREPLAGRVVLGQQLLTIGDDRVFVSTDLGAVSAVDIEDGRLCWAVTYPASPLAAERLSNESINGLLPPVYVDGVVYVKPNDAADILALDAWSGRRLWQSPVPGRIVHILGVAGSDLIVSGDQLWAIDTRTGRARWRFGGDDPQGFGCGRGVVLGDRILWPTREELWTVDSVSGNALARYALQEALGVSGGHLTVAGDHLVLSGSDHLTVFHVAWDDAAPGEVPPAGHTPQSSGSAPAQ
jgi:outer membrane protein assembly factor BamB